jgi:hypothetical protein
MNHKKFRRLYREERLKVRRRVGRKRAIGTRARRGSRRNPTSAEASIFCRMPSPMADVSAFWPCSRLHPRMPGARRRHLAARLAGPLARKGSTHTASSSTAITHSAVGGFAMSAMRAKPPSASILTLHCDCSTFGLSYCAYSLFSFDGPDEGWRWTRETKEPRPANDNGSRSGQSFDPRIPRIAAARTLRPKSRRFVLSSSVQPVAHCKATMLGFRMHRGIVRSQRSSEAARCFCRSRAGARR